MTFIYPNESFYVISGFLPPNSGSNSMGSGYNFSMGLNLDFALKAYNTEIPDIFFNNLNNYGKQIIKDFGENPEFIQHPFNFVENNNDKLTMLLRWCRVPGDACDLGIEGSDLDRFTRGDFNYGMLGYGPHNLDNRNQAYSLLSLWLQWANCTFAIIH